MSREGGYDLHRLRLLRELSYRGTLAAVAAALGYNPSSVSHQLTVLEREVGVPLLEPVGRGVRLTAAGEALVSHTEVILRELELARAAVAATRTEVAGVVRVASFQTVAHAVLPDVLTWLVETHPRLQVEFAHVPAEAAIPALMARDFDVVLSETYPGTPPVAARGIVTRDIGHDPLLLASSAGSTAEGLADLAEMPWVAEHEGSPHRDWFDTACASARFVPNVTFLSADLYLHRRLVEAGRCAAILPGLVVPEDPQFAARPLGVHRTLKLSTRAGSEKHPALRAVVATLTHATERALQTPM